jgi:CRP-like cAMP-binding protein
MFMENRELFKGLSGAEYDDVVREGKPEVRTLLANEVLFDEKDFVDRVWIIDEGVLSAVKYYYDGTGNLVELYQPPDVIGLETINTDTKRSPVQINAVTQSEVISFSDRILLGDKLSAEITSKLNRNAARILANINLRKQQKIDVLYHKSLRTRICTFLTNCSSKVGSEKFEINMDRELLSQYLGVNRSALSNELSKMRQAGLIEVHKGKFVILRELETMDILE